MVKAKKQARIKALALAVSIAAAPWLASQAFAAGLGRLTVHSAMGQPLRAELEISASKDELTSLSAQLASADAFRLAGVEYTAALTGLRFSKLIKEDGQRKYIEITTDRPLNEPFIDMLVELNWASGRLVREYTFLLDLPEQPREPAPMVPPVVAAPVADASAMPGPTMAPAPSAPAEVAGTQSDPTMMASSKAAPASKTSAAPAMATGEERLIRSGDTLGKIAREIRPEGVSLDQMLVALFRANPEAFEGNMNRMRAGRILRIPDAASVSAVDDGEARREVRAQAADFSSYRARLAARAAQSAGKDDAASQTSQGKLSPKVEEQAPAVMPGADKLAVSRTESGKDGAKDAAAKAKVNALEEDLVARDRALKDANSRIADLEKNLTDLKKLAELKSQAAGAAQKMAEAPKLAQVESAKPPEAPKPDAAVPVAPPAASTPSAPAPAEPGAPAATGTDAAAAAAPTPPAPKPPAPKPKPKVVAPPPEPEPEPSFIEENAPLVFGGAGVLALLLGYLGFKAIRRKKEQGEPAADDVAAPMTEPSASVASVFSDTVSASVAPTTVDNVATTSVLETVSDGSAAESIDPLDEADTYLAFGKDSQAEEILLDALKDSPSRWAIHLKLLEIYAARRSSVQFNTLAEDLRAQTGATGPEWERAAEMGRALDPNNSLYAAASEPAIPASKPVDMEATMVFTAPPPAAPAAPPAPVEEAPPVLDFDLGLDEPAAAPAVTSAPAADVSEVAALDFDLDLGESKPAAAAAEPAVETEPVPAPAAAKPLSIDFDLELPTPPGDSTPAEVPPLTVELPPTTPALAPQAAAEPELAVLSLDLPDVSSKHAATEAQPVDAALAEVAAPAAAPAALEVPSFDIDLGDAAKLVNEATVDIPLDAGENPEAATKLELALAYEEMGDRDGARELYQEVLAEGSAAQQATAKTKLEQLG